MKTSELHLEWKRRQGGGGRTQRDYLDFVIDGVPLSEKVGGDWASCLGWFVPEENRRAVRRLLLEESAGLPDNRRKLYVCPECGQLDCGAITAVVEQNGDKIMWRDFALVSGYDEVEHIEKLGDVGPFAFDRGKYKNALRSAL